jgi:hypothetical protein
MKVFISYRHEDRADMARRIHKRLVERFGPVQVFLDSSNLPLGGKFPELIRRALETCDALVAIIGGRWLSARQKGKPRPDDAEDVVHLGIARTLSRMIPVMPVFIRRALETCDALVPIIEGRWLNTRCKGKRRLDDPEDFVRLEIAKALSRQIPVIPVLLDGTKMPTTAQLPPPLAGLADCSGISLRSGQGFSADVDRLIDNLERLPRSVRPPLGPPGAVPSPGGIEVSDGTKPVLAPGIVIHGRGSFRELRALDDDGRVMEMTRPCYYGEIENAILTIRGTDVDLIIDNVTMYDHVSCEDRHQRSSNRLEGHGSVVGESVYIRYRVEDPTRQLSWEGVCVLSVPGSGKIHGYWMTAGHTERGKTVLGTLELER